MAAIDDKLAEVDAETTRIAAVIQRYVDESSDPAIAAKFAPVIERLKGVGVDPTPVF